MARQEIMRIGINLHPYRPGVMGGLGTYFEHLMEEMLKSDHEFVLYTAPWNDHLVHFSARNCSKVLVGTPSPKPFIRRLINCVRRKYAPRPFRQWEQHPAAQEGLDVWFCPFVALDPSPVPIPSVITVPDLQYETYPFLLPEAELASRRRYVPSSCESCSQVLTLSGFSKKQLVDQFRLPEQKVHVTWLSATPDFDLERGEHDGRVLERHRLEPGYLYYPANDWPHKNHNLLVIALHLLKRQGVQIPRLVLTGFRTSADCSLEAFAQHLDVDLLHLGYVPPADLPAICRRASVLVFPSLFEGFGIPLLEAASAGVPVAASNATSIPEIVGDAGVLFDPRDPQDIAQAIKRLLTDSPLRAELVDRGRRRAREFSWKQTATKTLDVFEGTAADRVRR